MFNANSVIFNYIMARTSYIQWIDDDTHFALNKHAELDFYSAISLRQQYTGGHVAPLGHIINANQSLHLLLNATWRSSKY